MNEEILLRFCLAALWGGIVGIEREYRSKSAGFRTMIMISIGACFFTMISMLIGVGTSPDRIASNILTGIGFIGAGVIFRGENRINGITTAATIWAVAAVGMGIGAGYYFAAGCASLLIVLVLSVLPFLEKSIERLHRTKTYEIKIETEKVSLHDIDALFKQYRLKPKTIKVIREDNIITITSQADGHAGNHEQFMQAVINDTRFDRVEF